MRSVNSCRSSPAKERLRRSEYLVAVFLETNGLVLIIRNTTDAIITPRGRHKLATIHIGERPGKKPFGFIE
jgi:hypothetical protein